MITQGPDVFTCGSAYAHDHPSEIHALARGGTYVRVLDLHRASVAFWMTPGPAVPPEVAAWPDDMGQVSAVLRDQHSEARRNARDRRQT